MFWPWLTYKWDVLSLHDDNYTFLSIANWPGWKVCLGRGDTKKEKISFIFYAYYRTADLEQLRAFPLALPATNDINPTLLAHLYALFNAPFSAIYATMLSLPLAFYLSSPRDKSYQFLWIHIHKFAASVTVKGVLLRRDWKIREGLKEGGWGWE